MSSESAKKRRRRGHPDITTDINMEALFDQKLSQMEQRMQSKIDSMHGEMDAMKDRLSRVDEMEKRCKYLEDKVASMGRSLKALARRWEYSAPDTPASHWIDRGFDGDFASEFVDPFINDINGAISTLQKGSLDFPAIGEVDGNMMPHDDALLPHWQNLADAIDLYGHFIEGGGLSLAIHGIQLSPQVLSILNRLKQVTKIDLHRNAFDQPRDGLAFAVSVARNNPNLRSFKWSRNPIDSFDDLLPCVEEIKRHSSISAVYFYDCFDGDVGYRALCSLLDGSKDYDTIDFYSTGIRTMGDTRISDFLATNPVLRRLDLEDNSLDDNDARLIADALKRNTHLVYLDLEGNDITEIGENALCKAISDSTSLNSVASSNHTCRMFGVYGAWYTNWKDPPENRREKIYHLLSFRHHRLTPDWLDNAHHFDLEFGDDSMGLVPKVLECVHKYGSGRFVAGGQWHVQTLSIFYELLRSWKMPSLYQNGRCS
ncbi:hypothetical protein ACHAXT_009847 [Thalassiosira profunda]